MSNLWRTATTPQPAPSAALVLATAAASLVVLALPTAWHVVRHLVTIVHEAGHAGVAVLAGRRLSGIRVHSDTSGLTTTRGPARGPGMVLTLLAGYLAPAVLGVGAAWLISHGYAVGTLWLLLVLLALVLLQVRNLYGLWAVLASAGVLLAVTWWGSVTIQVVAAQLVAWLLLLGAPRAVLELGVSRRRRRGPDSSDAGQLGSLSHLPGGFWVAVFALLTSGAAVLGGRWLLIGAGLAAGTTAR
ncbi:MAG: M50 family metallopeptidase [Actinobacteria bacterium]|nr:M50 family metallopeptidase [Actinomycetota bacterium]